MHTHTHTHTVFTYVHTIEHHHQKKGRHLQAPINKKKMDWKPLEKNLSTNLRSSSTHTKTKKKDDEWAKARTHRRGDRRRVAVVVLP